MTNNKYILDNALKRRVKYIDGNGAIFDYLKYIFEPLKLISN